METIEGALRSADGYWTVQIVRYGQRQRWYRILHATTMVADKASIATVQQILGDAFETLAPAEADANGVA